ncbi:Nuclear hormone receptor family member nhr-91 [Toxocara canis]|uniref:Nuclear hormone receptor family member nhr-91 n=1 Tax=Toxocara canis TaxID=6265 RepID=A0A0B2V0N4_TOXCA|nr:Nuclear hormone receptor family member nhr-91 [Toxocara canis]
MIAQLRSSFTLAFSVIASTNGFGNRCPLYSFLLVPIFDLIHNLFSYDVGVDAKESLIQTAYIRKVSIIQDQFVKALQIHLSQHENGARLTDILTWLPMLHSASSVLLHSKMFYVPFLICKNPQRLATVSTIDNNAESDEQSASSSC